MDKYIYGAQHSLYLKKVLTIWLTPCQLPKNINKSTLENSPATIIELVVGY